MPAEAHWDVAREAFVAAASWFVETVALVGGRWEEPGLAAWDVRALVGHTSRALLTVEEYLGRPAAGVEVASSVDYYVATRAMASGPAVEGRGRAAGEALGSAPAAAVEEIARRVLPVVEACDGTELLTTIVGGMRLVDYLPTRTFELVVHTLDLAAALSEQVAPPEVAASAALALVSELAVRDGSAGELLLAVTGRRRLSEGFSLL